MNNLRQRRPWRYPEFGGTIRRRTVNSLNLREYGCSNQTSGIHGTLCDIPLCKDKFKVSFL